jgi:hypothetical protein
MRSPASVGIAACALVAEVGLDMVRFVTAANLVSWARYAPRVSESAGKTTAVATTGHGNRYLARILGEIAASAARTNTFPGERYRRIARRRGKRRANVAIGRSALIIVWHLLSDPAARYHDLGADYHDTRITSERKTRNHGRQLQALGYRVTLESLADGKATDRSLPSV